MINACVDTSVLVDVLRLRPQATAWLQAQTDLAATPIVRMELIAGAQNKVEQAKALRLVAQVTMVYLTQADLEWAMQQQVTYVLSHNVGINDCLIASVSYRLQVPLYTTNMKHFVPLLGVLVQNPY